MSALVSLANPITDPLLWMQGAARQYLLQQINPMGAFKGLVPSVVPAVTGSADLTTQADHAAVVGLATKCGTSAGAGAGGCWLAPIARPLMMIGWVVLAVVLLARLVRLGVRGELRSAQHVILDLAPRMLAGPMAMQAAYPAMEAAIRAATLASVVLSRLFLSVTQPTSSAALLADMQSAYSLLLMAVALLITGQIVFGLMMTATIGLVLLGLVAPILIPLALYGDHGRIGMAWLRAVTTCLLILVVGPAGMAASISIAVIFNHLPLVGIVSGALAGEASLVITAIACVVLAKNAFVHTRDGFRVTFEEAHLDVAANLPGQMVGELRNGIEMAAVATKGAGRLAAGDPFGAQDLLSAAGKPFELPQQNSQDGSALSSQDRSAPGGMGSREFLDFCQARLQLDSGREVRLSGLADLFRAGNQTTINRYWAEFVAPAPEKAA